MLKEAEQKYPDIPYALKRTDSGYMPTTFKEVRQKARQFAAWLLANDLKAGDRAAIIAEGSPEWLISELGVLSAGMISVLFLSNFSRMKYHSEFSILRQK
jgi:long-chain acyl-CoA synthetase